MSATQNELKESKGGTPMVSVCVQTYQHALYIEQCLNSILNQKTDFDYEIILGEDESVDGTREICKAYAEKYPGKIRLFLRRRSDVILVDGKETGRFNFKSNLSEARGKYVAMCEGDDYWTDEQKLQKQVRFLESNPDYSLCFHKVKILKEDKLIDDYITRVPAQTTTFEDLAKGNYIHTPAVMWRNQIALPDWFDKVLAGDYALHLLSAMKGKLYCMDEVMAVYRVHGGGIWSTNSEDANQLRWIKGLNILCENISGTQGDMLKLQRMQWALVLYEKGYVKETSDIICESIPEIIANKNELVQQQADLITNPEKISAKVSLKFLLKAVMIKISNKFR